MRPRKTGYYEDADKDVIVRKRPYVYNAEYIPRTISYGRRLKLMEIICGNYIWGRGIGRQRRNY